MCSRSFCVCQVTGDTEWSSMSSQVSASDSVASANQQAEGSDSVASANQQAEGSGLCEGCGQEQPLGSGPAHESQDHEPGMGQMQLYIPGAILHPPTKS